MDAPELTAWPAPPTAPPAGARLCDQATSVDLMRPSNFAAGPPHKAFAALREAGGIAWHTEPSVTGLAPPGSFIQFLDSPGFWAVTSHALVTEVDRDSHRFSSEAGGTTAQTLTEDSLAIFRQMMLNMDHPGHTRLRRIVQPLFTPRAVQRLCESIEQNAKEIVDDLSGDVDLVTAVSAEMPLRVLADLFGMTREDRHLLFEWSNALLAADGAAADGTSSDPPEAGAGAAVALGEMMAYGTAMADERRGDPRDDMVSRIVTADIDGQPLSDTEFQMFWLLLVVAGNETTRNAVSGAVVALHEQDRWRWLAEHPEHLPTAVEELLRHVSPVQHFRRTATTDTVLGDQEIRAGDKVVIWFGAANRDSDVFAEPDVLDLCRDPNPHVAFGVGPHFCLGAHLARLEMTEMLRHLLAKAPGMTVGEPTWTRSNFINGIARLPVHVPG